MPAIARDLHTAGLRRWRPPMPTQWSVPSIPASRGRVILHVGAAKAGSSSLQTALSVSTGVTYLLWRSDGSFDRPAREQSANPLGYEVSSFRLGDLAQWSMADIKRAQNTLARHARRGVVVLSSEAWCGEAFDLATSVGSNVRELFTCADFTTETVFYVRPPAPWIESAYLQFGVWTGTDLPSYVTYLAKQREAWWCARAEALESAGLPNVSVRCVDDVVRDFFRDVVSLPDVSSRYASMRVNPRISRDLLALMVSHPEIRPDWSRSELEFVLARLADHRGLTQTPLPPLIGADLTARIEEVHADDVERLLLRLEPQHAMFFSEVAQAFSQDRAGVLSLSDTEMLAWKPNVEFERRVLSGDIADVLNAIPVAEHPDVARPQDRGAATNWRQRGNAHWLNRLRHSELAMRVVPRDSAVARVLGGLVDRVI